MILSCLKCLISLFVDDGSTDNDDSSDIFENDVNTVYAADNENNNDNNDTDENENQIRRLDLDSCYQHRW